MQDPSDPAGAPNLQEKNASILDDDGQDDARQAALEADARQAGAPLMSASALVDPSADQALLDQQRALAQGSRGVIEYVRVATSLRQRSFTHPSSRRTPSISGSKHARAPAVPSIDRLFLFFLCCHHHDEGKREPCSR
jgi:hypothetical protein